MGWKQGIRVAAAEQRRVERESLRQHRELQRQFQALDKLKEKELAANAVAQFENYIILITSLHKEPVASWDWVAVSAERPLLPPNNEATRETSAREIANAYKPGILERLTGADKRRSQELQKKVEQAISSDVEEHTAKLAEHQQAEARWLARRQIAAAMLQNNTAFFERALEHADAYGELENFGAKVELASADSEVISLLCRIEAKDIIPNEEVKVSATGKLSSKEMPAGKYWALYQDFICSAALRIAAATYAVLPPVRVIVNVALTQLNVATGHEELVTILAVHFVRSKFESLNLSQVDASECMANFSHRMKFKKTSGFSPVDPITTDEQWITTG